MNFFSEICDDLNIADFTPEQCQQFIDQPHALNDGDLFAPSMTNELMTDIIKNLNKSSLRLDSVSIQGDLKRIAALALSTLVNAVEPNSAVSASRLLLNLSSLPSASAYGLANSNIYNSLLSNMLKLITSQLKSSGVSGGATAATTSAPTTTTQNKPKKKSRRVKNTQDSDEEDDFSGEEGADKVEFQINIAEKDDVSEDEQSGDESDGNTNKPNKRQSKRLADSALDLSLLKLFLVDFTVNIQLFAVLKDEHLRNTAADLLSALLFYSSTKVTNAGLVTQVSKCCVLFATANQSALLASYRALMPTLTIAARNPLLPDVQKTKNSAHKAAVNVLHELIKISPAVSAKLNFSEESDDSTDNNSDDMGTGVNATAEDMSDPEEDPEEMDGDDTMTPKKNKNTNKNKAKTIKTNNNNSSINKAESKMLLTFKCIIGALQRMTVNSPDRAPIRSVILTSVTELLSTLFTLSETSDNNISITNDVNNNSNSIVHAINHYITFLAILSKSNKVSHRAFSLDISTALLSTPWVWALNNCNSNNNGSAVKNRSVDSSNSGNTSSNNVDNNGDDSNNTAENNNSNSSNSNSISSSPPHTLLTMLLQRCNDTAPSVRMRSLNAIYDLLLQLNEHSNTSMISVLYNIAMGTDTNTSENAVSLIDILRIRTSDEKPLVRSKAIQAFGRALSMQWPRVIQSYLLPLPPLHTIDEALAEHNVDAMDTDDNEQTSSGAEISSGTDNSSRKFPESGGQSGEVSVGTVSMLVTEEDVAVFVTHCSDASLSARKQALTSLTELLLARPDDAMIQDAYVQSVLPMAFDTESTVITKLCTSLHEILFENLVLWFDVHKNNDNISGNKNKTTTTDEDVYNTTDIVNKYNLVWKLCNKVSLFGLFKILKSSVGAMLKQNILKGHTERNENKANNLKYIIECLKFACCFHLNNSDNNSNNDNNNDSNSSIVVLQNAQQIQYNLEVSRGAWILLESIMSQEQINILVANSNTVPVQDFIKMTGSADFVVRCYKEKHSTDAIHISEEDKNRTIYDSDDLRILKVLEKIACNLSPEDTAFLSTDLLNLLLDMTQCDTQLVATAIAVKVQLSKNSNNSNSNSNSNKNKSSNSGSDCTENKEIVIKNIAKWSQQLLTTVETILHAYVFNSVNNSNMSGGKNTGKSGKSKANKSNTSVDISANNSSNSSISGSGTIDLTQLSPALQHIITTYLNTHNNNSNNNNSNNNNSSNNNNTTFNNSTLDITTNTNNEQLQQQYSGINSHTIDEIFNSLVNISLFILGEITMIGFTIEDDDSNTKHSNTKSNNNDKHMDKNMDKNNAVNNRDEELEYSYSETSECMKLFVPENLTTLVKILMGHTLPMANKNNNVTNAATNDSLNMSVFTTSSNNNNNNNNDVRYCPSKVRANAFITMGKICLRNKNIARDHVNIFLREISVNSAAAAAASMEQRDISLSHIGNDFSLLYGNINTSVNTYHNSINNNNNNNNNNNSNNAAVRSNALLVLGDLCVRYTHLVDRHVDTMSFCLSDSDIIVRKNALILLTQLLLQDFLKWKGFLLYRFMTLIVDSDYEICEFTKNLLSKTINAKFPAICANHFTETIIVLNNCVEHNIYTAVANTNIGNNDVSHAAEEEGTAMNVDNEHSYSNNYNNSNSSGGVVALTGPPLSRAQRFEIYSFITATLTDEAKIQVSAKIVQDILSVAVDSSNLLPNRNRNKKGGSSPIPTEYTAFEHVLEDTFMILRSAMLKVGSKKQANGAGNDDEGEETALGDENSNEAALSGKALLDRVKTKVLKKLSSQHLVSHILPVVVSLKHCLEATKSPLQGSLMDYLVVLCKHHKTEVEQVLQFDPTLKEEIEYDLKQYEKQKIAAEQAAKAQQAARIAAQRNSTKSSVPRNSIGNDENYNSNLPSNSSGIGYVPTSTLPVSYLSSSNTKSLQQLSSAVKPASLKKVLLSSDNKGRTPSQAMLLSSGVKSMSELSRYNPPSALKTNNNSNKSINRSISNNYTTSSRNARNSSSGSSVFEDATNRLVAYGNGPEDDDDDNVDKLISEMKLDINIATLLSSGRKAPRQLTLEELNQINSANANDEEQQEDDSPVLEPAKVLFSENNENNTDVFEENVEFSSGFGKTAVHRRSWSVVVGNLNDTSSDEGSDDDENTTDNRRKGSAKVKATSNINNKKGNKQQNNKNTKFKAQSASTTGGNNNKKQNNKRNATKANLTLLPAVKEDQEADHPQQNINSNNTNSNNNNNNDSDGFDAVMDRYTPQKKKGRYEDVEEATDSATTAAAATAKPIKSAEKETTPKTTPKPAVEPTANAAAKKSTTTEQPDVVPVKSTAAVKIEQKQQKNATAATTTTTTNTSTRTNSTKSRLSGDHSKAAALLLSDETAPPSLLTVDTSRSKRSSTIVPPPTETTVEKDTVAVSAGRSGSRSRGSRTSGGAADSLLGSATTASTAGNKKVNKK